MVLQRALMQRRQVLVELQVLEPITYGRHDGEDDDDDVDDDDDDDNDDDNGDDDDDDDG